MSDECLSYLFDHLCVVISVFSLLAVTVSRSPVRPQAVAETFQAALAGQARAQALLIAEKGALPLPAGECAQLVVDPTCKVPPLIFLFHLRAPGHLQQKEREH